MDWSGRGVNDHLVAGVRHRGPPTFPLATTLRRGTIAGLVLAAHGFLLVYLLAPVPPWQHEVARFPARHPAMIEVELLTRQPAQRATAPHRAQRTRDRPVVHAGPRHPVPPPEPTPPPRPTALSFYWQPTVASSTATGIDQALAARRARSGTPDRTMTGHIPPLPGQSCYRTAFHFVPEDHKGVQGVFTLLRALTTPPQLRKELASREYQPVACPNPPAASDRRDAPQPSPGEVPHAEPVQTPR